MLPARSVLPLPLLLFFSLLMMMATCRTALAFTSPLFRSPSFPYRFLASSRASTSFSSVHDDDSPPPDEKPLKSFVGFPAYKLPPPPPDVYELQEGRRVVCIGDIHGDLQALRNFLTIAQVMDTEEQWIGGDTICIQLGDVLDRGKEELACWTLLAKLSRQATRKGGSLSFLWGNHEALNAVGLFQYTLGEDEFHATIGKPLDLIRGDSNWRLQFAGNQPSRWASMEPGGLLSETLLANFKVALVVGRTLCVHAGLTKQHLIDYGGIRGMNLQAREWILSQHFLYNNSGRYHTTQQVVKEAQERANLASNRMPACLGGGVGSHSPVWMRDYSQPNDAPPRNPHAQRMITEVLEELQCDRMVMGHTPQFQINAALQSKAWRIDVGASRGVMGGTPEVLEIIHGATHDEVSILTLDGKVPASERQVVDSSILF